MDTTQITHIGLCAGYGGIELGLRRAIPTLRTVALCEIEAFACANLVAKMEAGLLDPAPIWTNLKTFPWGHFRDRVDILSGGYPCQPFSAAGKRLGAEDERHLWPAIADGIRILRPRVCFFENVEGHISLGLREVIDELGSMGYRATWGIFSAAEVGAPHQRKRVFVMAHRNGEGLERYISELAHQTGWQEQVRPTAGCSQSGGERGVANTNDGRSWEDWQSSEPRATGLEQSPCTQGRSDEGEAGKEQVWPSRPGEPQHWWEPPRVVADAVRNGRSKAERDAATMGDEERSQEGSKSESGPVAPSSDGGSSVGNAQSEHQRRPLRVRPRAAQHRGTSRSIDAGRGQAEPALGGDADGPASRMDYAKLCVSCDNRTDELRLLGNGVVPATAARAFTVLMNELTSE